MFSVAVGVADTPTLALVSCSKQIRSCVCMFSVAVGVADTPTLLALVSCSKKIRSCVCMFSVFFFLSVNAGLLADQPRLEGTTSLKLKSTTTTNLYHYYMCVCMHICGKLTDHWH